jgi:pimeloyl-ACP methyl ester carboxylesterase
MHSARSKDGTRIAIDKVGQGPALIMVDGALCTRAMGPGRSLAPRLAASFTVFTYDRRGRGDSGDAAPYAVQREIDDLDAVIAEAGGSADVFGLSSGAALALEAAARGSAIRKLVLYEAPFIVDASRPPVPEDIVAQMDTLLADDRRGDAVKLFMRQVGVPRIAIALMRLLPVWSRLKRVAHTLPYDMTIVSGRQSGKPLPGETWMSVTIPTLVLVGEKSPTWFHNGMGELARVLPNARLGVAKHQTHMVKPKLLAPQLEQFYEPSSGPPDTGFAAALRRCDCSTGRQHGPRNRARLRSSRELSAPFAGILEIGRRRPRW